MAIPLQNQVGVYKLMYDFQFLLRACVDIVKGSEVELGDV
jgi:hypothetical protein